CFATWNSARVLCTRPRETVEVSAQACPGPLPLRRCEGVNRAYREPDPLPAAAGLSHTILLTFRCPTPRPGPRSPRVELRGERRGCRASGHAAWFGVVFFHLTTKVLHHGQFLDA